jgi:hypothetical protein
MLESLKTILTAHAPNLLARTHLPRKHPEYLTQKNAFDTYRKRRLDDLAKQAPDLFARLANNDELMLILRVVDVAAVVAAAASLNIWTRDLHGNSLSRPP